MMVHLIDGTYELFRHFYGQRASRGKDTPWARRPASSTGLAEMIESGATHIGVATDHVIESFRNELWPGYKSSDGIEPALLEQFPPVEEGLEAMGLVVWPMVELEADDALASAAQQAAGLAVERVSSARTIRTSRSASGAIASSRWTAAERDSRRGGDPRKFGVSPSGFPTSSRSWRRAGWLSRHPRDRQEDGRPADRAARAHRGLPAECARRRGISRSCSRTWRRSGPSSAVPRCGRAPVARATEGFAAWAERAGDPRLLKRVTSLSGRQAGHPLEG